MQTNPFNGFIQLLKDNYIYNFPIIYLQKVQDGA